MILTITSLKGGTGKTTACGLWAHYLTRCTGQPVVLVDLDPQGGSTALWLDRKPPGPGLSALLAQAAEGALLADTVRSALTVSPYNRLLYVLPGDAGLSGLALDEPADHLARLLEAADLPPETALLIDTGTARPLVTLGMAAAQAVLIPVMLSPQSIKPTVNTLSLLQHLGKPLAGLLPVGVGSARWEAELLSGWQRTLATRFPNLSCLAPQDPLLPGLPLARSLVRGQWVMADFPARFLPVMQALAARLQATPHFAWDADPEDALG